MAKTASTAVAIRDARGLTAMLQGDNAKARIVPMLRGVEYDRVMGEVYLVASQSPEILECTPASIVGAVARAVSWGLTIGETVHLVPFNVKVSRKGQPDEWEKRLQAIQDYKGKIELIVGAGMAKAVRAEAVYENEVFEYEQGSSPFLKHVPSKKAAERGAIIGAYAIADHGFNRAPTIKYVPIADVNAIRARLSKQWKEGVCPPWYAMKTAVHQMAKLLPKNPRLVKVLATLEEDEVETEELPAGGPVATIEAPRSSRQEQAAEDFQDDRDMVTEDDLPAELRD